MNYRNSNLRLLAAAAILFCLGIVACSKDSTCKGVEPAEEDAVMQQYNAAHNIDADKHYTGMYYQILDSGSATKPTLASSVFVRYTGRLMNDTIFDQQTNPGLTGFSLSNLVPGWRYGLPMIGKGGHILLTIPSSMAYGCTGSKTSSDTSKWILENSPLNFDIELVDFY